jgi:molybdate transport repressor ModE-like protein
MFTMAQVAVVLAAGISSRMKEFKPMLYVGGESMIQRVIRTLREAGVGQIVVVTGYKASKLHKHLQPLHVSCVLNTDYETTHMYDSLKLGLRALEGEYDRVLVALADTPLVSATTIRALLKVKTSGAVCPTHNGRKGHPLILPAQMVPFLLSYEGAGGLRGAVAASPAPQRLVEVNDAGVLLDADTTDDYYTILRADTAMRGQGKLTYRVELSLIGTELFFDRTSLQFLELADSTGSIQTACGCMHLSYTSVWKMLRHMEEQLGTKLLKRMAGGTSGGGSALTAQGKALVEAYKVCMSAIEQTARAEFEKVLGEIRIKPHKKKS